MSESYYTAQKSKNKDSEVWSIIFRHPLRREYKTGKYGLRVRRGLKTEDSAVAEKLVDEMNTLLKDVSYHSLSAKERAKQTFSELIVSAFYDSIESINKNPIELRESLLPLPKKEENYSRILMIGSTGAGKTTLLRQLMGTNPLTERFPSTSPGKTTTFDTEVIFKEGLYSAVITFYNEDQVRELIKDCISKSVIELISTNNPKRALRLLLQDPQQRFRLSYILGRVIDESDVIDDEDDETSTNEDYESEILEEKLTEDEMIANSSNIIHYFSKIQKYSSKIKDIIQSDLGYSDEELKRNEDKDSLEELINERLEYYIEDDEDMYALSNEIIDDIKKRFQTYQGVFKNIKNDWPEYWEIKTDNKDIFIKNTKIFSSNYARLYGRLLAPIVNGMRIEGPFKPQDSGIQIPKIVIFDGEGLGHIPKTSISLPTELTEKFKNSDGILLVDNSENPMQAAPFLLIKDLALSGHYPKLRICFTHVDMKGDNFMNLTDKKEHLLSSLNNIQDSLENETSFITMRNFKNNLENKIFFLSNIQLDYSKLSKSSKQNIQSLIDSLENSIVSLEYRVLKPRYSIRHLIIAIRKASEEFNTRWDELLNSKHWATVKALTRHISYLHRTGYNDLLPVADLRSLLLSHIRQFIEKPYHWMNNGSEIEKETIINKIRLDIEDKFREFSKKRIIDQKEKDWERAFVENFGPGSTRTRKRDIELIYDSAVPIPDEIPRNEEEYVNEIFSIIINAIKSNDGEVDETN